MTGIPAGSTRPARAGEPCTRCGASGTHYLTCPSLRLSPGYLLTPNPAPPMPVRPASRHVHSVLPAEP
jgi:hypothetical protein